MASSQMSCPPNRCALTRNHPGQAIWPLSHEQTEALWKKCLSMTDLCHLQCHYLLGHLSFAPTYHGQLHGESLALLPLLVELNNRAFFTTFSQPSVDKAEVNGYYGKSDAPQCAVVSGWTTQENVRSLAQHWRVQADDDIHLCLLPPLSKAVSNESETEGEDEGESTRPSKHCLHVGSGSVSDSESPVSSVNNTPSTPSRLLTGHEGCVVPVSLVPRGPQRRPSLRERLHLSPINKPKELSLPLPAEYNPAQYQITSVAGGATHLNREIEGFRSSLNPTLVARIESDLWFVWAIDRQFGRKDRLWQFLISALSECTKPISPMLSPKGQMRRAFSPLETH